MIFYEKKISPEGKTITSPYPNSRIPISNPIFQESQHLKKKDFSLGFEKEPVQHNIRNIRSLAIFFIAIFLSIGQLGYSQQWSGNNNTIDPITRSGNVGIGTTVLSPFKLSILGDVVFRNSAGAQTQLKAENSSNPGNLLIKGSDVVSPIGTTNGGDVAIEAGTGAGISNQGGRLFLDAGNGDTRGGNILMQTRFFGNVGISTPSDPIAKLEVRGPNIASVQTGSLTSFGLGTRYTVLGDRPPNPSFISTGLRTSWNRGAVDFILLQRGNAIADTGRKDGAIVWQDATVTNVTTATSDNHRLRFIFRDNQLPSAANSQFTAATLFPKGELLLANSDDASLNFGALSGIGRSRIWRPNATLTQSELRFLNQTNITGFNQPAFTFFANRNTGDAPTQIVTMTNVGRMGVNVAAPGARLEVVENVASSQSFGIRSVTTAIPATGQGNIAVFGDAGTTTNSGLFNIGIAGRAFDNTNPPSVPTSFSGYWAGYFQGDVGATGTVLWNSDKKFKKNITPLAGALRTVSLLNPCSYNFSDSQEFNHLGFDTRSLSLGFIAQELEQVLPEVVKNKVHPPLYDEKGELRKAAIPYKAVNYVGLIPVLVKAIQEQQSEIETLKNQVAALAGTKNQTTNSLEKLEVTENQLGEAIPNPNSGRVKITYNLKKESKSAQIKILNLTGLELKSFPNISAESEETELDLSGLPNGVYFYILIADGQEVGMKKMIVSK